MDDAIPRKPVLIVLAGPNGSGKTTICEEVESHEWGLGCLHISPDEIAEREFDGWNDWESVKRAAEVAARLREDCLANKASFLFETVLSVGDKVEFIARAKQSGFFVRVFFVCTQSPAINVARVARRVASGGHAVPEEKIVARYYRALAQAVEVARVVDRAYFYDNSVEYVGPRLLVRTVDGKVAKCYEDLDEYKWARGICEAI